MTVTASELRQNIYRLLDRALATGEVIEIQRRGRRVRMVPDAPRVKLSRLAKRPAIHGDPEELVHMDWSKEWRP